MSALDMGYPVRALFTTVKQHFLTDTRVCLNELIQFLVGVNLKMLYCAENSPATSTEQRENLRVILFKDKTYIFETVEATNATKTAVTIKIPKLTDHFLPDLSLSFRSDMLGASMAGREQGAEYSTLGMRSPNDSPENESGKGPCPNYSTVALGSLINSLFVSPGVAVRYL